MPSIAIGTMGYSLVFTARIPPEMQKVLQKKLGATAAFDLTPNWGDVPTLSVASLRRFGVQVPDHWAPTNEVYPVINGMAFYIVPEIPHGMAASFSMQGVNLRTGMHEEDVLTDDPCQSYWTTKVRTPYIDGYRPSKTDAVRQFVPLRGESMVADVSDHVGVAKDHPWKDGISAAFYLPADFSTLGGGGYGMHELFEKNDMVMMGAETIKSGVHRVSAPSRPEPERVGMGAGALMKQQHPDVPGVTIKDYLEESLLRMTARIVWVETWNEWAQKCGESMISATKLQGLESKQRQYEASLLARFGGTDVHTEVDQFPTIK